MHLANCRSLTSPTDSSDEAKGMEPVYTEYNIGHYTRSFTLSNKIDQERISAQLDDGVLTLTLPKAQEAQPRRISIG
jgi:HSP20 family protein